MADLDKDILIVPNTGQTGDPTITFSSGATGGDPITLSVVDDGTTSALSLNASSGNLLYVKNGGNVGIGINNPSSQLHLSKAGGTLIKLGTSQNTSEIEAREVGAANLLVFSSNNSADHMAITSSGDVGIGTISPASTLHIVDSPYPRITLEDGEGTNDKLLIDQSAGVSSFTAWNGTSNGVIDFKRYNGTTTSNSVRIDTFGSVGIGTTTPGDRLHVAGGNILHYSNATTASLTTGRNANENIVLATTDGAGSLTYNQDETDGTDHSFNFIINSSGTNSHRFTFNEPLTALGEYYSGIPEDAWAFRASTTGTSNDSGLWFTGSTARLLLRDSSSNIITMLAANGNNTQNVINGNTIWHAGNDGSGSGLDADLLDGVHASRIPYALSSGTGGGTAGTTNTFVTDGGIGADNITRSMFFRDNNNQFSALGIHVAHSNNANYAWQIGVNSYSDPSTLRARVNNNGTWTAPVTIWNSGNHGPGSTLNADKLDNEEGSYYLNYNNFTNTPAADTLDSVTDVGNTTTNDIIIGGLRVASGGATSDPQEGKYYKYFLAGTGVIDNLWKKVCDVSMPGTGSYNALEMRITLYSANSNFGNTATGSTSVYSATYYRSGGTPNDPNNAVIHGEDTANHGLRIIKTATGSYELQILQKVNYKDAIVDIEVQSTNGGTVTMTPGIVNGSTTGTAYTPTVNTAIKLLMPQGEMATVASIPTNNNQLTNGAGYVVEGGTTFSGTYPLVVRTEQGVIYSNSNITFNGTSNSLSVGGPVIGSDLRTSRYVYDSDATSNYLDFQVGTNTGRFVAGGAEAFRWGANYLMSLDNDTIRLGGGSDFRMWHDGNHTYFRNYNSAAGNMYWQGYNTGGTNQALAYFRCDNARTYVQLFENGEERLRTTSSGVTVYGALAATGNISGDTITATSDSGLVIRSVTNGAGALLEFSDHSSGSYAQKGYIEFFHADGTAGALGGSGSYGAGIQISSTESSFVTKIEGDLVTSGTIYKGTEAVVTGNVTGSLFADVIAANTITADMIQANSVVAEIITAEKISAGSLVAGSVTVGTSTSTLKLYDDCLKIFESGNLRVKLGNLSNTTDE